MNPYSHLVIASKLEAQMKPEQPAEYYWGAVAPDARYPAKMQRFKTHLPAQQILGLIARYPQMTSFLQGYLVHCLADEVDLGEIFFQHLPFSLFKNKMTRQHMAISLELYHFENERVDRQVSGTYNEVLSELGLSETICANFAKAINLYSAATSNETRVLELFEILGLENDSRIQKYWAAAQTFQKNPFLISAVFFGMRTGKISEEIVRTTSGLLNAV